MNRILITGSTGNIGFEVIKFLFKNKTENKIVAGVRNIGKAKELFKDYSQLDFVNFDFENADSFDTALDNIDTIFLLRPPHISDTEKYFRPLIDMIKQKGIHQIVFLSVQGAKKSKIIPHNRIEKLVKESGLNFIFLRPSYFMQNLTTTFLKDIQIKKQIILPAGNAKFNWIDVENIGEIAALVLDEFDSYKNQILELTGDENENFATVAEMLSQILGYRIEFVNTNPFKFYRIKKEEGVPKGMIFVMIMLHFLPRCQKAPEISHNYKKLIGKDPTTLKSFLKREKYTFSL